MDFLQPVLHLHTCMYKHMGVCAYRCTHTHALTHTTYLTVALMYCWPERIVHDSLWFHQTYLLTFCIDCYISSLPYCGHLRCTGRKSGALAKTEQMSRLDFNFMVINFSLYNLSWCSLCSLFRELQDIKVAIFV